MGTMGQSMGSRMASSSRSTSSEIFNPNDMTSNMNPMLMGNDGVPNMTDDMFTAEMLAQMGCVDGSQDMMSGLVDPARASTTLTITIEDADPNHVDGIASMLLRSRTKFRMQHS